jgi:hypothetical protein
VCIDIARSIKVQHGFDGLDIEAASSNIGGDQYFAFTRHKVFDDAGSFALYLVSMKCQHYMYREICCTHTHTHTTRSVRQRESKYCRQYSIAVAVATAIPLEMPFRINDSASSVHAFLVPAKMMTLPLLMNCGKCCSVQLSFCCSSCSTSITCVTSELDSPATPMAIRMGSVRMSRATISTFFLNVAEKSSAVWLHKQYRASQRQASKQASNSKRCMHIL